MPGMYGYFGRDLQVGRNLSNYFQTSWNDCTEFSSDNFIIGAHAHFKKKAVLELDDSIYVLVDGDINIYNQLSNCKDLNDLVHFENNLPVELKNNATGNMAIFNAKAGRLYLFADISGSIPLYYSSSDGNVIFSSLLKPVAHGFGCQQDPIGVIENVCLTYTLSNRTVYRNIFRILPGQYIVFDLFSDKISVYETSKAWTKDNVPRSKPHIIDQLINELNHSVSSIHYCNSNLALMFSAGWDSRIILSFLTANSIPSLCFTHGNSNSRELLLAKKICSYVKYPFFNMPFDVNLFDLDDRMDEFNKSENISFPYWYQAGKKLREMGYSSVISGILGEIIGGQFSPFDYYPNWKKTINNQLLLNNRHFENKFDQNGLNFVRELLYTQIPTRKPWFISDDFWNSIDTLYENVKCDIDNDIDRIVNRGVTSPLKIIEALKSECRGVQKYFPQIMSCRAFVDIHNLFGMRSLYTYISKIPLYLKATNSLSKDIVRYFNEGLLKYPTGAVLLKAKSPIRFQELSKVIVKSYENAKWLIYFKTDGRFRYPNLEWNDFEYFRSTNYLNTIVDNINNPIFDKNKLVGFLKDIKANKWHYRYFLAFYQIMRLYSNELLLNSS